MGGLGAGKLPTFATRSEPIAVMQQGWDSEAMRKIVRRDYLALSAPAVVTLISVVLTAREKGLFAALLVGTFFSVATLSLWIRRIQKHPEDTWRARL